ncbi:MAG: sugar phosphate isomerase/epimerase family protein [Vicinamibacteria bacterium]
MSSRRRFLSTLAAGMGAAAIRPGLARAAMTPEVKSPLGGPIGLQLYSLRAYLPKDIPGTLARLRSLGIREVEGGGPAGTTAGEFRTALDKADLVCQSIGAGFDRVKGDMTGVLQEAKTLGARFVMCAWIPHDDAVGLTRDETRRAVDVFNAAGQAAKAEGVRFAYHCHGYEFLPSTEGTLFDTIVKETDPSLVSFEIDIFWAKAGGADPAKLVASLPGRVPLMHIKDMRKGLVLLPGTSKAPDDANVVAGTGQLDLPAILRAARRARTEIFYIEDESEHPWEQVPESLKYLSSLQL